MAQQAFFTTELFVLSRLDRARCDRDHHSRDQIFDGSGVVGTKSWTVSRGDLFVVPSWEPFSARSEAGTSDSDSGALDLFRFSDASAFEATQLNRTQR